VCSFECSIVITSSHTLHIYVYIFVSALHKIPLQVRFGMAGLISNILFMILYNGAIHLYGMYATASTIYAVVYFFFIPISHALTSLLVFGWPKRNRYLSSLLSNYPIGLTAIALGAVCTAHLDRMDFNNRVEDFLQNYMKWEQKVGTDTDDDGKGEFYSSLVVMVITSVWSYVLSVAVNTPSADEKATLPLKKEL
jgi:hypothetical protein